MRSSVELCRLFVAIALPEEIKASLVAAQSRLASILPRDGVSWTRGENLHVTLRFLGNVLKERCEALARDLSAVASRNESFELKVQGIGSFPNVRRPRVLWAGVHDELKLIGRLHQEVSAATAPFTSEPMERNFSGHITLARIKHLPRKDEKRLLDFLHDNRTREFGTWHCSKFLLMRSELSAEGSHYRCLAELPFRLR
jgi:2'-5' RNA ligase